MKEELRESFDGIPSILSASVDEVKQGITEALKGVRLREKRDSLHDYFIGLAYLYGIDVEVNHEKAVEIIEGAARRGCLSAIKKASDIYYYAIGNGKDLAKAIAWQKRYTLALKAAYSLDRQEEELLQYLQEELCLAKMQREAGELSVARNTCWRVLMYCKRDGRYGAFFSPTRIPYYVQAYDILGDIFHTREDKLQSIECYEKALKEAERQAELAGDDLGALALFGRICFKLGNAYLSIKDSERFMKLTDRLTNMVELPRLSFIGSIERIGVLFQKGIRAFEKIKEIEFSEDNLRNLASSYVALCDFYMQYKSFGIKSEENALFDTCEQALQIFEDLKTRSFTVMHCKGYCEALLLKGSLFQMYKKNAEALAEYDKALLFVSMLPREMQTVEIEDFVCRCNLEKAKLLSGLKMRLGCLATCRNCIQYAKQLYETYGKDIYAVYMAEAYFVGSFFFSPYGKEAYKLLSALCYKTDEYGDLFFQVCLSLWERKLLKLQDVPRTTIYADEERNGGIWFSNSLNSRHTFIRFRFIGTQPHKKILAVELSEFTLLSLQGSSYKDIDLCEMGFFTSKKETRPDDYFVVIFADGTQCEYQRCYG